MFPKLVLLVLFLMGTTHLANAEDAAFPVLNFYNSFHSNLYISENRSKSGYRWDCRNGTPHVIQTGLVRVNSYPPELEKAFNENCIVQVYAKATIDAKIEVLNQTIAAQMKTIEDLINKNYKSIANDRQFKEIIERKVSEALKAKGL